MADQIAAAAAPVRAGLAVRMSDGWRGKVESSAGGIVACIADGERPNDHWCGAGYRLTGPSSIAIEGGTAVVAWKPATRSTGSAVDREQRRAAVVADLLRSALRGARTGNVPRSRSKVLRASASRTAGLTKPRILKQKAKRFLRWRKKAAS